MKGKVIFIHENASGYYRVSAYLTAKLLLELLPKRLIPVVVGGTLMYFMMGFQIDPSKFFIFLLTLSLTTITAAGISFVYGALVTDFAVASLFSSLTFIIMMIFGGFLVNIASLPYWLQWIQYLSIFRLAVSTLSINELSGLVFNQTITPDGACKVNQTILGGISLLVPGECYLEQQGIMYGDTFDIWRGIVELFGFAVIVISLTYLVLLMIKKEK